MFVSPQDAALYLLHPGEIDEGVLPDEIRAYQAKAKVVVGWARTYLCRPHPSLGRDGPVCPYTEASLQRAFFWLTIYQGSNPTLEEISAVVNKYRDWFVQLAPAAGKDAEYKTILILFPDLAPGTAPRIIDVVQAALKPEFVTQGLMIGQFYDSCDQPGLWNQNFRPLCSSVPLLAIRHMVRTDAAFLTNDALSLAAYLQRFGHDVPIRLQPAVRAAACIFGLKYCNA